MLPFGVKVLWFVLALTGMICSWIVLIPFGRAVGNMWGPMLFAIGNTVLQIIFCLGMIWKMDPFLMPRSFCVAQTLIIGCATYMLTGVAGAFSMATSLAVLQPKSNSQALQWRNIYLVPILIFPVLATIVHTVAVLVLDSVQPTDDLHCDSTDPEWVRFLGYAGLPFLVSLPCMYLSVKSLMRLYSTNKNLKRARMSNAFSDRYTSMPKRSIIKTESGASVMVREAGGPGVLTYQAPQTPIAVVSSPSFVTANEYPPSPRSGGSARFMLASSPVDRKFHMPFKPPEDPAEELTETQDRRRVSEDAGSEVSSTLPTFVNPDVPPAAMDKDMTINVDTLKSTRSNWTETSGLREALSQWGRHQRFDSELGVEDPRSVIVMQSVLSGKGVRDDKSEVLGNATAGDGTSGDSRYWTPMEQFSQTSAKESRTLPNLVPAIWRIVLFQTAFCIVQILTCITTIIDLATHRPTPIPLGTQHFALLLAAWGPVVVFGHSPVMRSKLKFWSSRTP